MKQSGLPEVRVGLFFTVRWLAKTLFLRNFVKFVVRWCAKIPLNPCICKGLRLCSYIAMAHKQNLCHCQSSRIRLMPYSRVA